MRISLILITCGVAMLIVALVLPYVVGGSAGFSDELRSEIAAAGQLHEQHERLHASGASEAEHAALDATGQDLLARVEAAQNRGQGVARIIRWSGLILASAGLAMLLIHRTRTS